jgi:hypothetical protein
MSRAMRYALALILCSVLEVRPDAVSDWLVSTPPLGSTSSVITTKAGTLLLSNGLVSREFALQPAFGTIDWSLNATTARGGLQSMFRAVMPEGKLQLDNTTFDIGGLAQQRTFRAYCNRSEFVLDNSTSPAFRYVSHSVGRPLAPFPWVPGTRGSPPEYKWPPPGKNLAVVFAAPHHTAYRAYKLTVHYEIYDGLPLISKWFTLAYEPDWYGYLHEAAVEATPPAPAPPSGTIGGWKASGGQLSVKDAQLDLALTPDTKQTGAGAGYQTVSSSAGMTLAARSGSAGGEEQTTIGFGLSPAGPYGRGSMQVWASCDAGGVFVDSTPRTQPRPARICSCKVGDTIAIAHDSATKKTTVSVNGVAMGWLAYNGTAPLYPQVQVLAPAGYSANNLLPATGLPPPPPPPPPAPPTLDAIVNLATVELFGAMPRFGSCAASVASF